MEEKIEKTFATPDGCDLLVENIRGEIAVEGWDRPDTEVVAVRRKGKAEIEITQDGRKVIARTKHEQNGFPWLEWLTKGGAPIVDYRVRVPFASDVKLKNVNGPIGASQVQGKVRLNSVDGTASLSDVSGEIVAETVNGTLKAENLEGTAKLNTVNGKMKVDGGTLRHLKADTVNGDIEVTAMLAAEGDYAFNTVNGGCRLALAPDFRAHVSAHGVNLSVDCEVPNESVNRHFGNWEGTIGTGSGALAKIHFSTVNGRLRIDNAGSAAEPSDPGKSEFIAKAEAIPAVPEPPQSPASPEPPVPPDVDIQVKVDESPSVDQTQLEVLQMIERGELSVDEAIKLLKQ